MAESAEIEHAGETPRTVVTDVNTNTVSAVIEEDHHSSIRKLADNLHIPRIAVQCILIKELGMKHICSMWVPHFLWAVEMECCRSVYSENLARISQDSDFFFPVITGDKSWFHNYNPETKYKPEVWFPSAESRMKKVHQQMPASEMM